MKKNNKNKQEKKAIYINNLQEKCYLTILTIRQNRRFT